MTTKQVDNDDGSNCHSLPFSATNCHSLPKTIRVSISKPQHIELLRSVSAQLGSSNLKDGLEHILNCWLVGNVPTGSSAIQSTVQPAIPSPDYVDEFDSLISFE